MRAFALLLAIVLIVGSSERAYGGVELRSPASSPGEVLGLNDNISLAIHLVASNEYLECGDLCPADMTCEDINCDLSLVELEASGGYGYAAFVAYNVNYGVSSLDFYVIGWPIGPGTPDFTGPVYCAGEAGYVGGEPFEKRGGIGGGAMFPCEQPCTGMFCVCSIAFGPSVYGWLPITLEYAPSNFGYPSDPHNYFFDCTVNWESFDVAYEHPAVIGGTCDPIPNCEPGPTGSDGSTWGAVKELYR